VRNVGLALRQRGIIDDNTLDRVHRNPPPQNGVIDAGNYRWNGLWHGESESFLPNQSPYNPPTGLP
jgi:hypothetical protein